MFFCFVSEDIKHLDNTDPLYIQIEYAKRIKKFIFCDFESRKIMDENSKPCSVAGEKIFLRASCDTVSTAIKLITDNGGSVLESESDIKKIEHWESLPIIKRNILSLKSKDLSERNFNNDVTDLLLSQPKIFIKSRKKGFSIVTPSEKVLCGDPVLDEILKSNNYLSEDLLLSKCYEINKDSLGKKEARFFVFNGKIYNSSRAVHSVRHSVPKSFIAKAQEITNIIGNQKDFPFNYVLDLAEFRDGTEKFIDVLELNPITSSLCYINNSIFNESVREINDISLSFAAGYEYCLDALKNPERYVFFRGAGENYEYCNPEHYIL